MLEQAPKLEEAGAGLQLSPNASRVLIALGLRERLEAAAVAPKCHSRDGRRLGPRRSCAFRSVTTWNAATARPTGRCIAAICQLALADVAQKELDVKIHLGVHVEDFAAHVKGVSVLGKRGTQVLDERGIALIGADGIWSSIAGRLREQQPPTFRRRTAWRALIPADAAPAEFREPFVHLWLGSEAHLVHYPVKAGSLINIVAIVHDEWNESGWSAAGERGRNPAPFRALVLVGESARADCPSRPLAQMGAVRPQHAVSWRQGPGDA